MHSDYVRANVWTSKVIAAAIEVHKEKGPGLIESIYEKCMMHELALRNIPAEQQVTVPITYKDYTFKENLFLDVYVDKCLILELKSVQEILPIHKAQLLSYMKLMDAPLGLLINFNHTTLKEGLHRLIPPGADEAS